MAVLRLILGDQLNTRISSLEDCDKAADTLLLCEVWEEATYVKHHKKKIAFLFSAMRHFAQELEEAGYNVTYIKLTDNDNSGSFRGEVQRALDASSYEKLVVTEPGEWRVLEDMRGWGDAFGMPVEMRKDTRFLVEQDWFAEWAKGRKQLRMEYFYREQRKRHNVLMEGDEPVGGKWNYDAENRKSPKEGLDVPAPYKGQNDAITKEVLQLVGDLFADHFGDLEPFHFAVTRDQALYALRQFIEKRLAHFGDYQDAMVQGEPWMYHSHISFYLNCGLLLPMECIEAAEQAYHDGNAPLNAVEGFVRQILGWREYVRCIYWHFMPDYAHKNFFHAQRNLPDFFWDGETKMNCLRQCVTETKQNAYTHHIQRLMVIGNFALLAGLDVGQVNEWYLLVYADAYEWVEMPNVTGMILYADGGMLGSKPYAAGGAYINKMSDYCKDCHYKVSQKTGEGACPFNYMYWDFLARNRGKLEGNPRLGLVYKSYDRMDDDKKQHIRSSAEQFLERL